MMTTYYLFDQVLLHDFADISWDFGCFLFFPIKKHGSKIFLFLELKTYFPLTERARISAELRPTFSAAIGVFSPSLFVLRMCEEFLGVRFPDSLGLPLPPLLTDSWATRPQLAKMGRNWPSWAPSGQDQAGGEAQCISLTVLSSWLPVPTR